MVVGCKKNRLYKLIKPASSISRKEPITVTVDSFSHDGRGLARIDGKVVFIDGALPGEKVRFQITNNRRDYADAKITERLTSSPDRIEPKCPHFGVCGGCSLQHLDPERQLEIKQDFLKEQFDRFGKLDQVPMLAPISGPHWRYRGKARLSAKLVVKKARVLVGFREKNHHFIADIDRCEVLYPKIGNQLTDLSELIMSLSIPNRVPQVEVAVGENETALVFRILNDIIPSDREKFKSFESRHGCYIYLQWKGPDHVEALSDSAPLFLSYSLPKYELTLQFKPTDFIQINSEINRQMIDRALQLMEPGRNDRILDLFCGIGNFSLPIARYAGAVVGVEGSYALVERAKMNADNNGLDYVEFYTTDLNGDISIESWAGAGYNKVLLDPTRTGASEVLSHFPRWGVKKIIYISCNPATLARDAGKLVHDLGYDIVHAGVIDMFPHTAHVESIAVFERR